VAVWGDCGKALSETYLSEVVPTPAFHQFHRVTADNTDNMSLILLSWLESIRQYIIFERRGYLFPLLAAQIYVSIIPQILLDVKSNNHADQ